MEESAYLVTRRSFVSLIAAAVLGASASATVADDASFIMGLPSIQQLRPQRGPLPVHALIRTMSGS